MSPNICSLLSEELHVITYCTRIVHVLYTYCTWLAKEGIKWPGYLHREAKFAIIHNTVYGNEIILSRPSIIPSIIPLFILGRGSYERPKSK